MSDTPLTDEAFDRSGGLLDMCEHAKKLERENQALREALAYAEQILSATECSGLKQLGNGPALDLIRAATKTRTPQSSTEAGSSTLRGNGKANSHSGQSTA